MNPVNQVIEINFVNGATEEPPLGTSFLITEDGNQLMTEDNQNLTTE